MIKIKIEIKELKEEVKKDAKNPMNRNETTAGFVYIYWNENNTHTHTEHLNCEE